MRLLLALALSVACTACHSTSGQRGAPSRFTLCHLVTGPRASELSLDESSQANHGHMANMTRLAEEGALLIAGPFGSPREDRNHRGIFIFDTPDPRTAETWVATDPAIQAGLLGSQLAVLTTTTPLDRFPELYAEYVEERGEAGDKLRTYVIATTASEEVGARTMESPEARVVIGGRSDDAAMRWFFILDFESAVDAHAVLEYDFFGVSEWYSTASLVRLADLDA